jgi:DNA-binding MarR family transcriptional regulator
MRGTFRAVTRSLAGELKQTRPFPSKSQEAAVALLRTADIVRRAISAVIEPHGITVQQYNVLRILRGAGERGLPTLEIAERMVERTPGITRLIDRLEAKKLVTRERSNSDRRQVFCRITPAGISMVGGLDDPMLRSNESGLGALSKREMAQLIELLDRARESLNQQFNERSISHEVPRR